MTPNRPLQQILDQARSHWDSDKVRPEVKKEFGKVVQCRTLALGAELYASNGGQERIVPHTCKSRVCPSCGQRYNFQ